MTIEESITSDLPALDEELTFTILKCAVQIARDRQIGSLDRLKQILAGHFPGNDREIQEALSLWGKYERQHGDPRFR